MPSILESVALKDRFDDLPQQTFAAGESVLRSGEATGKLLFLESGTVEVLKDDVVIATIHEPGVVFGELSALLDQPHGADIRAVDAAIFRVADAAELLRNDAVATLHIAVTLARRLDIANHALVEVQRQVTEGKPRSVINRTLDRLVEGMRYHGDPDLARHSYVAWM